MPEHQQIQKSTESKSTVQKQATPLIQSPISHPMAIIQRARINPKSLTYADVMQLQRTIGNRAVGRLLSEIGLIPSKSKQAPPVQMQTIPEEEEKPLQGKMAETIQRQETIEEEEPLQGKMTSPIQRQEIPEPEEEEPPLQGKFENKPEQEVCPSCSTLSIQQETENRTGMPDDLKAGVENLSGMDMSDVQVHYNSSKPAEVGALAYTQGTNIHVAPGQERHLPHEAWHVVQQAQGRVRPTMQLKDVAVNDDEGLEKEADTMGSRAISYDTHNKGTVSSKIVQRKSKYTQLAEKIIQKTANIDICNSENPSEIAHGTSDPDSQTDAASSPANKKINNPENNKDRVLEFTEEKIPNQDIYDPKGEVTEWKRSRFKCAEPNALGSIMEKYPHKVGSNWLGKLQFTSYAHVLTTTFEGDLPPCAVCKQWVTEDLKINPKIIKLNIKSKEEEEAEKSSQMAHLLAEYTAADDKNPTSVEIRNARRLLSMPMLDPPNKLKRLREFREVYSQIINIIWRINSLISYFRTHQQTSEHQDLTPLSVKLTDLNVMKEELNTKIINLEKDKDVVKEQEKERASASKKPTVSWASLLKK